MKKKISIVNHEQGNKLHIIRACEYLGFQVNIVDNEKQIMNSDKLIIPGVGRFGTAMNNIKKKNIYKSIKIFVEDKRPVLGICLGFQLLFYVSQEDENVKGLQFIKGEFLKFPNKNKFKIPQIQWNQIKKKKDSILLKNIEDNEFFYFNHTFYLNKMSIKSEIVKATTDYNDINYPSVIENENVFGTQFHPEKSGLKGLEILNNFKNF